MNLLCFSALIRSIGKKGQKSAPSFLGVCVLLVAIIFVDQIGQLRGYISNCVFWKTCLVSMIIIRALHPLTICQGKHMMCVVRTLLPLEYWSFEAPSILTLGLATRCCQLEALYQIGPKKNLSLFEFVYAIELTPKL